MRYKNIAGKLFGLVTKHACDRRTDGQNYDSQDRASIGASCSKNFVDGRTDGRAHPSSVSLLGHRQGDDPIKSQVCEE